MRAVLILAAAGAVLAGCSTAQTSALLQDLKGCERHYNGVVAAGTLSPASFSGSVKIDCPTAAVAPAPSTQ